MKHAHFRLALAAVVMCMACETHAQFLGTNFITGNADGAIAATSTSAAIGTGASAPNERSSAVGQGASALAEGSTALGQAALAESVNSVAIGDMARATGADFGGLIAGPTAVGTSAAATGAGSTALGGSSRANGYAATAVGASSHAHGEGSIAIGYAATALGDSSMAIGSGASAPRHGQVAIGTTHSTYTTPGITSAASRAAQTGPTQFVTTDAAGNLAAADFDSLGLASAGQVERNSEGVSMAMALSGVPNILPEDANYAVSSDVGVFNNEAAIAIGGAARLTDNIFLNGGGAIATSSGYGGGRAGVTFAW